MYTPVSLQELDNARQDVESLEKVINGNEDEDVTTRLGETYPTINKAVKQLFENGGLPATPFETKALMTTSGLVDGDYAVVTNDELSKTGIYKKENGHWVHQKYNNLSLAALYTDTRIAEKESVNYDFYTKSKVANFMLLSADNKILYTDAKEKLWHHDFYTSNEQLSLYLLSADNKVMNAAPTDSADITIKDSQIQAAQGELYVDNEHLKKQREYSTLYNQTNGQVITNGADTVYAFYDNLMTANPEYITRRSLGNDTSGKPIYEYRFKPPTPYYWGFMDILSEKLVSPPQVVVFTGVHGGEYSAIIAAMSFFDNLVNNWRNLDGYSQLRFGAEFIVIPCTIPWGVDNMKQGNMNLVDINRNFPTDWGKPEGTHTAGQPVQGEPWYKGESPASEIETQLLMTLPTTYPDAVYLDFHQSNEPDYIFWLTSLRPDTHGFTLNALHECVTYAHQVININASESNRIARFADMVGGGLTRWLADANGGNVQAVLYESAPHTHAFLNGDLFKSRMLNEHGLLIFIKNIVNAQMQRRIINGVS